MPALGGQHTTMIYLTYVLRSNKDYKRYIGSTNNLNRRIAEHNAGKVISTRRRKPMELIFLKKFATRKEAETYEKFLKTGKGREWLDRHRVK